MKPVVAILGRPNVGKSRLFNRLLGRTKALVEDTPGVTRDRNYALADIDGHEFVLVDTGGFEDDEIAAEQRRALAREIRESATAALDEADVVVLVLDGRDGINPADAELVDRVRRSDKPAVYVVNKIDHVQHTERIYEFYELGIEDAIPISAAHGLGLDELLDAVFALLPAEAAGQGIPEPWADEGRRKKRRRGAARLSDAMATEPTTGPPGWRDDATSPAKATARDTATATDPATDPDTDPDTDMTGEGSEGEGTPERASPPADLDPDDEFTLRVAVLGRPNVGKSTLVNRLLGYERCLVSDVAGTTRDSIDTYVELDGRKMILIDTAGIRRRARIEDTVERKTVRRALRMVEAAHVVLLLVDAVEGITDQDARLGELARERGRAIMLVANKWDLLRRDPDGKKAFAESLQRKLPHLKFAPVLRISALHGSGLGDLLPTLSRVDDAHRHRVPTAELNRWLRACVEELPPPLHHHHLVRLYYATQAGIRPPRIVVFTNTPEGIPDHYARFLVNRFRRAFPLPGAPVLLSFRKR